MKLVQIIAFCSMLLLQQASAAAPSVKGVKQTPTHTRGRNLKSKKGKKSPEKRSCKFSDKDDEVKFSCRAEWTEGNPDDEPQSRGISLTPDEEIKDKISYKVSTKKEGIKVKVEYKAEYQDDETDEWDDEYEETKTTFEVKFDSLIEYAKGENNNSPNPGYDFEFDDVVQTIPLAEWMEFSAVMSDEDEIVSHFNTTTVDGMVAFNFTISRAAVGEKATANSMKIDVNILDFPWMQDNTYVALMSTVKSKLKVYMEYDETAVVGDDEEGPGGRKHSRPTDEVEVSFEQATGDVGFVPFGAYRWEDLAETRTTPNTTNVTLVTNEDESEMYATFENGESVLTGRQGASPNANATVSEEAKIDSIRVVATSPEQLGNETYQIIAYSFVGEAAQGASDIYWDPETGIGYADSAAYGVGFAASVVGSLLVTGMMLLSF